MEKEYLVRTQNNNNISYKIIRSNIKNIYIQIRDGEVLVKASKKVKDDYIKQLIVKREKWIIKKLQQEKISKEEDSIAITTEEIENLKQIILESISYYGKNLKAYPNKITIKNIKYAWGSCSAKKNITINAHLAHKSRQVIEYVVLHEMCHLKQMNHSEKFWNLVEENMPNYKEYRKALK